MEQALDGVEVAHRVGERRQHHQRRERGHPAAERIDREGDPDRHAVARPASPHPVCERLMRRVGREQHADRGDGRGGEQGEAVLQPPRRDRSGGHQQCCRHERDRDRERCQVGHRRQPVSRVVPAGRRGRCCRSACAPGRSMPAAMPLPSPRSRRRSAPATWTTGSTSFELDGMSARIGALPPLR